MHSMFKIIRMYATATIPVSTKAAFRVYCVFTIILLTSISTIRSNTCLVHRGLLFLNVTFLIRKVVVVMRPSALARNENRHETEPDEVKTEQHPTETHGTLENDLLADRYERWAMLRTYPENTAQIAVVFQVRVAVLAVVSQNSGGDNTSLKRGGSDIDIFIKPLTSNTETHQS